ncbi:MAG: DSD1 family PLP-dependent enzyme [Pseudomonadota bacterium]
MYPSLAHNKGLIGQAHSRDRIDTPALVLDLDAFEHNIEVMSALARERGIGLRPHAKTHKSIAIGRAQMAAGAVGLCCAKLGEAEVLAAGELDRLLLTSTVLGEDKIRRLLSLNEATGDLAVVVDHPDNARDLGEAAASAGQVLSVLIVCDVGSHRFGVVDEAAAIEVGKVIAQHDSLRFRGVQGYAGFAQHIEDYAERREASLAAVVRLGRVRDALAEAGWPSEIVTGSGTGTHDIDHEPGIMTDLQVGSYIFSDVQYDEVVMAPDAPRRFRNALFVHTRVVSSNHTGFVTTDAGSKSFSKDGPEPRIAAGAPAGSAYGRFGDEFGRVTLPDGATLDNGRLLVCVVPHCDPTINLYDHYHCVRGDRLVDLWPVDARGRAG